MKKILTLISLLLLNISLFCQIDTVNTGTAAGSGDGDPGRTAFYKVNKGIHQININTANIDTNETNIAILNTGLFNSDTFKIINSSGNDSILVIVGIDTTIIRSNNPIKIGDNSLIIDELGNVYLDTIYIGDQQLNEQDIRTITYVTDTTRIITSTTIYLDRTTGSDTTGDGSIGSPYRTIKHALEQTNNIVGEASTLTYHLNAGSFNFTGLEVDLLNQKKSLQASVVILEGSTSLIQSSISLTHDAINPFRWNASGQIWTPSAYIGYYIHDGADYYPIHNNGADYLIIPTSTGLTTVSIYQPTTTLNYGSENLFIQPSVNDKTLTYQNLILNGTGKLKAGNITPLGNFFMDELIINCKQINVKNVTLERSFINASLDGVVVVGSDVNLSNLAIEGDGGSGDYGIIFKDGKCTAYDILINNFNTGIDYESGLNYLNTSGTLSLINMTTGFSLSEGSNFIGSPNIYLNTITSLYNGDQTKNVLAVFDESIITGVPTAWVSSDNGLRIEPKDNYTVYIKGIHTPTVDTMYVNAIKYSDASISTTAPATKDYVNSYFSGSLTDGAPTATEINTITGLTPSTAGTNRKLIILDSDGTGLYYDIISTGSSWVYFPGKTGSTAL